MLLAAHLTRTTNLLDQGVQRRIGLAWNGTHIKQGRSEERQESHLGICNSNTEMGQVSSNVQQEVLAALILLFFPTAVANMTKL